MRGFLGLLNKSSGLGSPPGAGPVGDEVVGEEQRAALGDPAGCGACPLALVQCLGEVRDRDPTQVERVSTQVELSRFQDLGRYPQIIQT